MEIRNVFCHLQIQRLVFIMGLLAAIVVLIQLLELPYQNHKLFLSQNSDTVIMTVKKNTTLNISTLFDIIDDMEMRSLDGKSSSIIKDKLRVENFTSTDNGSDRFWVMIVSTSKNVEQPLKVTASNISMAVGNFIAKRRGKKVMTMSEMNSLFHQALSFDNSVRAKGSTACDRELQHARLQIENAPIIKDTQGLYASVFRNVSTFIRSYELMERTLKVYIYNEGEKPIFHEPMLRGVYASEGWFMKLMEGNKKFVTKNPKKAHLFYLPFSSRNLRSAFLGSNRNDLIKYLDDYVDIIARKYKFWDRRNGSDHFLVACHDWKLKEKASFRNPDEFYFGMIKTKTVDGVHQPESQANKYSDEELSLMKSQDIGYVLQKVQSEKKVFFPIHTGTRLMSRRSAAGRSTQASSDLTEYPGERSPEVDEYKSPAYDDTLYGSTPLFKTPPRESLSKEELSEERLTNHKLSETALRHFNEKHWSDYEYVEEEFKCNWLVDDGDMWYHINFKARNKSFWESPSKLFFAELKNMPDGPHCYEVTHCRNLDGLKQIDHCCYCDKEKHLLHPTSGFKGCHYEVGHHEVDLRRHSSLHRPPHKNSLAYIKGPKPLKGGRSPLYIEKYPGEWSPDGDGLGRSPNYDFTLYSTSVFDTPREGFSEEVLAEERLRIHKLSETALRHFNEKHGTNYEHVEEEEFTCNWIVDDGDMWYHLNIKARDKSVLESPSKLFFAELKIIRDGPHCYRATHCRILDGVKQVDHCCYCDKEKLLLHPTFGFKVGRYEVDLHRLSSLRRRPHKKIKI